MFDLPPAGILYLPGPRFLAFHGIVAVIVLVAAFLPMFYADATETDNLPSVPAAPDPIEVAYLSGGVNAVLRTVDTLRKRIKVPLLLENVTTVIAIPGAQMDEAEFLSRVLERTGCGWLCDVANLYANAVNHGVDIDAGSERWPWDRVVQVHYAGGMAP